MDQEKIRKEAKQIMDDFMSALDKVEEVKEEFGNKRDSSMREPKECKYKDFKTKILANAPKKEDDCILAEKKKW